MGSKQTEGWAYIGTGRRHWVRAYESWPEQVTLCGKPVCRYYWSPNPQPADCCKACIKALAMEDRRKGKEAKR